MATNFITLLQGSCDERQQTYVGWKTAQQEYNAHMQLFVDKLGYSTIKVYEVPAEIARGVYCACHEFVEGKIKLEHLDERVKKLMQSQNKPKPQPQEPQNETA